MNGRVLGPQGVPVIGSTAQPIQPFLDMSRVQEMPDGTKHEEKYRLPGVAVLWVDPSAAAELAQHLAPLIAPLIVAAVLEVAAQASAKASE